MRRTDGRETWKTLLDWDKGQTPSERLAATLLGSDGFLNIDPSHPLGGKDGKKDALLKTKDGLILVVAVYFPRGQQSFTEIKRKFKDDLYGINLAKADGAVFFTNQELKLAERTQLTQESQKIIEVYHLERISTLLNLPKNYGVRLEFLDIEMRPEEILAFYNQRDAEYLAQIKAVVSELKEAKEDLVKYTTGGDSYPKVQLLQKNDEKDIEFLVEIKGEYPIYDVVFNIHYLKSFPSMEEALADKSYSKTWSFKKGTLNSNHLSRLGFIDYPDKFPTTLKITSYARNGVFYQHMILDLDPDGKVIVKFYQISDDREMRNILDKYSRKMS